MQIGVDPVRVGAEVVLSEDGENELLNRCAIAIGRGSQPVSHRVGMVVWRSRVHRQMVQGNREQVNANGKQICSERGPLLGCVLDMITNGSLPGSRQKRRFFSIGALLALGAMLQSSHALEVWDGPTITFTDQDGADPTQATNQDRITGNVWITRSAGSGQGGIYNARVESGYQHSLSPVGTEWASGALTNYASLIYTNWEAWTGLRPPDTVGQDAVLHVVSDDVYLSIQFTSWGVGRGGMSGFSYVRSTPSIPEPAPALLSLAGFGVIKGIQAYRSRRRRDVKRDAI
jgi:hypothetical protein